MFSRLTRLALPVVVGVCSFAARGDEARLSLVADYESGPGSAGTWQLVGSVEDTGSGASGEFGFSAIRFFLTDIDYGIDGNAISLTPNLGALDPINAGSPSERPPAVLRSDGIVDLIYGQDLSESDGNTVVFGVGVASDTLLATGTFSAGMSPGFGRDGETPDATRTQARFLPAGTTPFVSPALLADRTHTRVLDNLSVLGDYTGDGRVDAADYTAWRDQRGSTTVLAADGDGDQIIDDDDYLAWAENYASPTGSQAVPEPAAWLLTMISSATAFFFASSRGRPRQSFE